MANTRIDPPLTIWYCDNCKGQITEPHAGTVSWNDPTVVSDNVGVVQNDFPEKFYILHKGACDNMQRLPKSHDLNTMLGVNGLQWWAGYLWNGPTTAPMNFVPGVDLKPAMELLYRLQVPYYEQARRYFNTSYSQYLTDSTTTFTESTLRGIIEREGEQ
ncbi:hypothetical protein [Arthrobacter sp. A2-55]|uniref:hypothetical protein n=1 Tax=Arthrobacter sp. A2-55 TaxID=2897337 RepID=UPI0021CD47E4|nr:hypothetical protein [Arthrobacter sp. A2-55]MCU6481295.1 hypothetical protein [Arthrobacter sp. A2-55]